MKLYADGLNTKQISGELSLSQKTVWYHRVKIFQVLKLNSFADMVKAAIRLGISSLCVASVLAGTVNLVWVNPSVPIPNLGVNIWYTTDISIPTNQWPLLVYIPNTAPGTNSFLTDLPPANYFFIAAYTNNFWHTNLFFSNGAATPLLPTNLVTGFSVLNH